MSEENIKIGQILKTFRVKKKYTIEKISHKTKISIQNIENIERGHFDLIGGKFYQKSFLKLYSKALRISDRKIVAMFDGKTEGIAQEEEKDLSSKTTNIEKTSISVITDKIPTMPLIFFASLGLIIFFITNLLTSSDEIGGELASIKPKTELKTVKVERNLVDEIEKIKKDQETPIQQTNVNIDDIENFKIQNYSNFLRQIIAKEDVWIEIKDKDENILISTILKKDESFNLPSNKEDIVISASNAGALFLKDKNSDHSDLGAFGRILDSVNLNSLITNH
tara:strand:+ start:43 stop:882 length:840 start_codon:yes stop_codon:yes gene_type:complete